MNRRKLLHSLLLATQIVSFAIGGIAVAVTFLPLARMHTWPRHPDLSHTYPFNDHGAFFYAPKSAAYWLELSRTTSTMVVAIIALGVGAWFLDRYLQGRK